MSEYWKSTPSYWCKFCQQYVRDTAIERKNHEASAKHQNNIQRNLRELHKGKEREERDKQRAKDEVARLNGMFGGGEGKKATTTTTTPAGKKPKVQPSALTSNLTAAQQRKAHAEQLAALGVELPEELKKEVTGVGNYQVVNAREVEETTDSGGGTVSVNRSLAEILAETRREEQESIKAEEEREDEDTGSKGIHKRKAEDDENIRDEEAAPKMRKAWGSSLKTYPGKKTAEEDVGDLDALLNGVKKPKVKMEKTEQGADAVKKEEEVDAKPLSAVPDIEGNTEAAATKTETAAGGAPAIVFKKRKGKK